jgi:hypothetical protein
MPGRQSVEQETEIAAQACAIPTIPAIPAISCHYNTRRKCSAMILTR